MGLFALVVVAFDAYHGAGGAGGTSHAPGELPHAAAEIDDAFASEIAELIEALLVYEVVHGVEPVLLLGLAAMDILIG